MSTQIAMSGLRATNQELAVISNNIANSSTVGYRTARAEYSSVYTGGNPGGVSMGGSSQDFSMGGSLNYTGRELDMAIEGNGFFMVQGSDGTMMYSRAGMYGQDAEGNIVDPYGNTLQGYPVTAGGDISTGQVTDLTVDSSASAAKETSSVEMVTNLDSRSEVPTTPFDPSDINSYNSSNTVNVYDSLGNEHAFTQYYVKTGANTWEVHYEVDGVDYTPTPPDELNFDSNGALIAPSGTGSLTIPASDLDGAGEMTIDVDWASSTQYGSDYNNSSIQQDGYAPGELTGIRIAEDGMVYGTYTNGTEQLQGQVVLADFTNPNGLEQTNNTTWTATPTSGAAIVGAPGSGTLGTLNAGYVEGSNVDVTNELVGLMAAQSNYQANAKVLTAADTMTQSLMNAI
ncbi:flagellar hook protein FlgE [Ferrimonas lipolytica]|uniref:Flagellar hook protein FlgE n=1 Tax=Ferrimonas lipolytica TaxID=2724191 RepID=A0A6H1UCF7_9GAMM|nr:flagellar hook protein FlgE [Ferrimonas lipolytica]QIZ76787.1 flagellar basal body protein FlgE [Ferrimonas lipolytica]